jgi:hypothetical protein
MASSKPPSETTEKLLQKFELEEVETPNTTDAMVSALKSGVGIIPFWGPTFSEAIALGIPNQRIDRVVRLLKMLAVDLGEKIDKSTFTQPGVLDIFSEGARQAANAYTEEKIALISTFVAKSITDEQVDVLKTMLLASILEKINHVEVIILHHCSLNLFDRKEFEEDNQSVFLPNLDLENPKHIEYKGFIQNCYVNLDSLGLIYFNRRKTQSSLSNSAQITITGAEILRRLGYQAESSYTYQELIAKEESEASRSLQNALTKLPGGSY